jgi:hypothetical protein
MDMQVPDTILDEEDGVELAYKNKNLAFYLIELGLNVLRGRRRRQRRLEIKAEAPKPEKQAATRTNPRPFAKFSDKGKTKMSQMTNEWLGATGWHIGKRDLLDFTRGELLLEIDKEYRRGNGHLDNARWYEALVEPMKSNDQTIGDFWRRYKGTRPMPPERAAA